MVAIKNNLNAIDSNPFIAWIAPLEESSTVVLLNLSIALVNRIEWPMKHCLDTV